MNRLSLKYNWLKLKTAGKLAIVLEEFIKYALIYWRMSTCNRLNLQTLGSQPVMSKNLPDHWSWLNRFRNSQDTGDDRTGPKRSCTWSHPIPCSWNIKAHGVQINKRGGKGCECRHQYLVFFRTDKQRMSPSGRHKSSRTSHTSVVAHVTLLLIMHFLLVTFPTATLVQYIPPKQCPGSF